MDMSTFKEEGIMRNGPAGCLARTMAPLLLGLMIGLVGSAVPSSAQVMFGCDNQGQLFTVNLATGAGTFWCNLPTYPDNGATEIELQDVGGLGWVQGADGVFVGQSFSVSVNVTGCRSVGPVLPTSFALNGLEWVSGVLFGTGIPNTCQPSELLTLDPATGSTTVIGPTGKGPIAGLAWDAASHVMYGVTGCWQTYGTSELVTIDLMTGAAGTVGNTGVYLGGLEFGPDGILYAGGNNRDGGKLYRIDTATGAAMLVGPTGFSNVTGLSLLTIDVPIEDTTWGHIKSIYGEEDQ